MIVDIIWQRLQQIKTISSQSCLEFVCGVVSSNCSFTSLSRLSVPITREVARFIIWSSDSDFDSNGTGGVVSGVGEPIMRGGYVESLAI